TNGAKKTHDGWPIGKGREHFQTWFADKLKSGGTAKSKKSVTLLKKNTNKVARWSLNKMISEFGEQKAKEKAEAFDKDPTKWRPDRDAGKDGPRSREHAVNLDSREEGDEERDTRELGAEADLDTEERQMEAEASFASMRARNAGSSAAGAGLVAVKQEEGEPTEVKPEESATFKALKTDGKKVVFNVGKALTIAKQMFIDSKGGKFLGELNMEIANNVKEMTQIFASVEDAVLQGAGEATMLALSMKIDKAFDALNSCVEWFNKFNPKESQQKKQKI
ncbi:unnamed protein product, partial [Prorocentrum cordatum]